MSDYIPEGKLDPTTFQSVMDAADVKYCLAKVSSYLVRVAGFKNYVDKMRWVGGQKMPILVQVQGKKYPSGGR